MKRYNAVVGGVYDNSVMVEEKDGDWVWYEDAERLIAAAPELLEALEALQPYVLHLPDGAPIKETIRAVIAKAKGEQP